MSLKTFFPIICCLLYFTPGIAQKKQNVYFLKNSGAQVKLRDSADYIRVVSEPDSGATLYNVKDYYKSGKLMMIGKTSKVDPILLEEECMAYYPSGKKKQYSHYKQGHLVGDQYTYYPNGRLYVYTKFASDIANQGTGYNLNYHIMACNDSTGKELTVDGNGYYIGYNNDFKTVKEEGSLKAGIKDGKWKGNNGIEDNYITYAEEYSNGKLVSGESVDRDNKVVTYTVSEREPQYKGGITAFYAYLGKNVIYPINARRNFIQGTVYISFVVEKDGSLTDVKVARSPNEELSAEALKTVKNSPNWEPGLQYGRAVRVQYTVPVKFSLGSPN